MKISKLVWSVFLCVALLMTLCFNAVASTEPRHALGLIPEDINIADIDPANDVAVFSSVSLPSSYDLSSSVYFPPIQNQGNVNSCAAFAYGYYQFTYERNRLNGVPSTLSSTWASPMWIYNTLHSSPISGGGGDGLSQLEVEHLLKYQGAISWEDMPYQSSNYDKVLTINDDGAADMLRQALQTRFSSSSTKSISASEGSSTGYAPKVTSADDTDLNEVKALIADQNKILTVGMRDPNVYDAKTATNGEQVWYRAITTDETQGNHAMVVVGYNDNIACDINGDGIIEQAEKGAFKLANSWGTGWKNDGYIWVMYDALNLNTAVSGQWESNLVGERYPIFTTGSNTSFNFFKVMYVENKNVQLTAEINFCSSNLQKTKIVMQRNYYYGTSVINSEEASFYIGSVGLPIVADGVVAVIDFSDLFDYASLTSSSYQFGFDITLVQPENEDQIFWFEAMLTDELGNSLTGDYELSFVDGTSYSYRKPLGFSRGDVTYDHSISSNDALVILQYINGQKTLSKIQKYLADYNNDGQINNNDVQAILQNSLSNSVDPNEQTLAQTMLNSLAS